MHYANASIDKSVTTIIHIQIVLIHVIAPLTFFFLEMSEERPNQKHAIVPDIHTFVVFI